MIKRLDIFRKKGVIRALITITLAVAIFAPVLVRSSAPSKTWTLDADFDQGLAQGVNHDTPNNDQLQLSASLSTFPVMWIANSGESTVSKIDTNTGREVGRYRTFFYGVTGWTGPAPSRTAVDSDGNVYVLNRMFNTNKGNRAAVVVKILATGGIDRNGNGVIDTSVDADNNGVIGGAEIKPLVDSNNNGDIDPDEITDERVVWVKYVGGVGQIGRALAMGTDGNLWVGTYNDFKWYKVSSVNGSTLAGPYTMPSARPYGAVIDSNGILWSASLGSHLGKLNTNNGTATSYLRSSPGPGADYGIAIGNGKVYQALYAGGLTYAQFDPVTSSWSYPAYNYPDAAYRVRDNIIAVAIASNGDIIATRYAGGVYRFAPDGKKLWFSPAQAGTGEARGAIIDSNGDIWVNHLYNNNVSKFRGSDGAHLGVFPVGSFPYTYSDATGISALSNTTPTGYWTVVYDGAAGGTVWDTVSWNGATPTGTSLEVRVRAADTAGGLDFQTYQLIGNDVALTAITGRYIQIQVKFLASQAGSSPTLNDITVKSKLTNQPPTADAGGPYIVNEGGTVVLNGAGNDPDGDSLIYSWDLDNDGTFETLGKNPVFSAVGLDGPSNRTVVLMVSDNKSGSATDTAIVTIVNVNPVITNLASPTIVALGATVYVDGNFTDAGVPDTHSINFNWGNSATSSGSVNETGGSGTFIGQYIYSLAQFYTITATLNDDDGGVAVRATKVVVTATGNMTGGGRVDTGSFEPPKGKGGKPQAIHTTHGFVLIVNPDLTLDGNLQYNDQRNGDVFHATSFTSIILIDDPLLDTGNPVAKFDTAIVKGVGRLNGVDGVKFEAVITDNGEPGKTDTFKITFPDGQSTGVSGLLVVGNHQAH